MTTIILTIIGILLAAAAALMVIFYGGDAFNSGTVGAQANQIQNAGTNLVSAGQMFRTENPAWPTAVTNLTTAGTNGAYLDELPALPQGVTLTTATQGTGTLTGRLYQITNVPIAVCNRINSNLRLNPAPAAVANVAATLTSASAGTFPKMACVPLTTGNVGVFYARS